jgi:cytochrome c556
MKRIACVMGVLAVLIAAALGSGRAGAEDEAASIKSIMGKLHKGANAPLTQLKGQLKADTPDWASIQKGTKDFVMLGASLAKFDPPKGEAAAYKALAKTYYQNAKDLDTAAEKRDAAATKAAFGKLAGSCKECHSAHKGQ